MQVKAADRPGAYARDTISDVVSRAKDTHTPNRVIRLGDEWDEFGEAAGKTKRAAIIKQFVQWYLRYPGVKLPVRPERRDSPGQ